MYPVDGSAATSAARTAAAVAHTKAVATAVDLKKKYVGMMDVVYSSSMTRRPRVPQFKREDED